MAAPSLVRSTNSSKRTRSYGLVLRWPLRSRIRWFCLARGSHSISTGRTNAGVNGAGFDAAVRLRQFNIADGPVSVQANAGAGFSGDGNSGGRAIAKAGLRVGW